MGAVNSNENDISSLNLKIHYRHTSVFNKILSTVEKIASQKEIRKCKKKGSRL